MLRILLIFLWSLGAGLPLNGHGAVVPSPPVPPVAMLASISPVLVSPTASPSPTARVMVFHRNAGHRNVLRTAFVSLLFTGLTVLFVWMHYRKLVVGPATKYSTFAPRFWTGSVDSLVLWPLSTALAVLGALHLPPVVAAIVAGVDQLAWLVYSIAMHGRCGQTVGKMVTKVRVVDYRTEGPISWRQALLRDGVPLLAVLWLLAWEGVAVGMGEDFSKVFMGPNGRGPTSLFIVLASLPGFWFLAELITMLTNEKRRALHDFIAGTVVIRTNVGEPRSAL